MKPLNLVGQKFGKLTVLERVGSDHNGRSIWMCLCDCGNSCHAAGFNLKSKNSKSCGCMRAGFTPKNKFIV